MWRVCLAHKSGGPKIFLIIFFKAKPNETLKLSIRCLVGSYAISITKRTCFVPSAVWEGNNYKQLDIPSF